MATPEDYEVADLVFRARAGEAAAWDALVDRFGGRVRAVGRSFRLGKADADDVYQVTWLRLVSHLDQIRDPGRVGAWLVTTASHECLRLLRRAGRQAPGDADWEESLVDDAPDVDADLLVGERERALWEAMEMLSAGCQRLLRFLAADPAPSYEEVALGLDMPIGSIGPTRRRCLNRLRIHFARITEGPEGSSP